MTIVVGPAEVRGPGRVDAGLVDVALASVDEELAVCDDHVVTVGSLWCRVAREVCDGDTGPTVLVVPTTWPAARVEFVEEMLRTVCVLVVVRRRAAVLLDGADAVVEIGPDCALVARHGRDHLVVPRGARGDAVADSVLAAVADARTVAIDAADGVAGASALADVLARRLRRNHVEVSVTDDAGVLSAAEANPIGPPDRESHRRRVPVLRAAAMTTAAATVAILAGAAMTTGADSGDDRESTWIVEGRVAVQVPTSWSVRRITSGPGSARVQAVTPDGAAAIHVTGARVEDTETTRATADALRVALDRQPRGAFADFNAEGSAAGRPAVTYNEIRSSVPVAWAVVVDRGMRIAVGCQHPPARHDAIEACERAIGSARSVP